MWLTQNLLLSTNSIFPFQKTIGIRILLVFHFCFAVVVAREKFLAQLFSPIRKTYKFADNHGIVAQIAHKKKLYMYRR